MLSVDELRGIKRANAEALARMTNGKTNGKTPRTRKNYDSHLGRFDAYCEENKLPPYVTYAATEEFVTHEHNEFIARNKHPMVLSQWGNIFSALKEKYRQQLSEVLDMSCAGRAAPCLDCIVLGTHHVYARTQ